MSDFGTPGGALAPAWGGNIKLHVWVALATGTPWHLGPHDHCRLDSGNVLARPQDPSPDPVTGSTNRLWVDVSCDVLDVSITTGATSTEGVFARAEAGTATVVLADPDRAFDPLNTDGRWMFQGRSRLTPGVPIMVWAEVLQHGVFLIRRTLFLGTVDSWHEPWTPDRGARRCTVQATDLTRDLVARERPALDPPVGAGETTEARLQRILDHYDGPPLLTTGASTATLAATDHSGSAWVQLNETADAEIGFVHVATFGRDPFAFVFLQTLEGVVFHPRATWAATEGPVFTVKCPMLIAATVTAFDDQVRNVVVASRDGGETVTVRSQQSIDRYGERSFTRSGLALADDAQVGAWAAFVVRMFAFPRPTLTDVTLRPSATPEAWPAVLQLDLVVDRVHVDWTPPGENAGYDIVARVVGVSHDINRQRWEVKWTLGAAETLGRFWTLGPDEHARFDAGNVLAFTRNLPDTLATEAGDDLVTEAGDTLAVT